MFEPVTVLELQLKDDPSGIFCQNTLQLLNMTLQSLGAAPEYRKKTLVAALRAAADIIDTVGNQYL